MLQGFKTFISRGNVIDLAVGVIMGAAFGQIVDSLVKDLLTPVLGLLGGQPDFSAIKPMGIGVGNFLNALVTFAIKAAGLYLFIVLPVNRFRAKEAVAPPPPPSATELLLVEIRDLLRAGR
jgi:large conductance mechanosensitive channel